MLRTISQGTALVLATLLVLSGCSPAGGKGKDKTSASPTVSGAGAHQSGGSHVRQVWFGKFDIVAKLDLHRVERYPHYSVLQMDLYNPTSKALNYWGKFGSSRASNINRSEFGFSGFGLLDSVGKKYYPTLREGSEKGEAFGTRLEASDDPDTLPDIEVQPGVRNPVQVYFPPLPAGVKQVTVMTPGSTGEMTGIPVIDTGRPVASVPKTDDNTSDGATPKPGQTFTYPVHSPSGKIWSQVQDLHETVQGLTKTTTSGGDEQTLGLRADVLFAYNSDKLNGKAAGVLDDAVNQTRAEADPSKPPILITGHTDDHGGHAYNMDLSMRRAKAVQSYLSSRLGSGYQYQAAGKGETQPVAANKHKDGSDNPEGRARNRRVEIRYKIKQQTPQTTTTRSAVPGKGGVAAPAGFRTDDGPVVGSVTATAGGIGTAKLKFDVHPFYRDGAYIVSPLSIKNLTDSSNMGVGLAGDDMDKAVAGSGLGQVIAIDPAGQARYFVVRRGDLVQDGGFYDGSYLERDVSWIDAGATNRAFIYYPAPPPGTSKLDLQLGKLGTVKNVPIK